MPREREPPVALALYWLPPLLLMAVARAAGREEVSGALLANLLLAAPMLALGTVVHEAGHVLLGRLSGVAILRVHIGAGPTLWRGRMGPLRAVLRALPFVGRVQFGVYRDVGLRRRLWLAHLGGPLANGLVLAGVGFDVGGQRLGQALLLGDLLAKWAPIDLFVYGQAVTLLASLVPRPTARRRRTSDLAALLRIPFYGAAARARMIFSSHVAAALAAFDEEDYARAVAHLEPALAARPEAKALQYVLGTARLMQRDYAAAYQHLQSAMSALPQEAKQRANMLSNLAWAAVMLDDPALLQQAAAHSAAALTLCPDAAHVQGTRGAVLVALGQAGAGLSLLQQAGRDLELRPQRRACYLCWQALALRQLGERDAAAAMLEAAVRLSPDCELLPRALSSGDSDSALGASAAPKCCTLSEPPVGL